MAEQNEFRMSEEASQALASVSISMNSLVNRDVTDAIIRMTRLQSIKDESSLVAAKTIAENNDEDSKSETVTLTSKKCNKPTCPIVIGVASLSTSSTIAASGLSSSEEILYIDETSSSDDIDDLHVSFMDEVKSGSMSAYADHVVTFKAELAISEASPRASCSHVTTPKDGQTNIMNKL